ncbi:hypothetical protein NYP13_21745, partial [Burkholderia pseudomallei]|nr:hypothetical protein [Burkholderia pseudomallei]MCT7920156.1 hypothetical protein [Burkholderia pseudomallei]
IPLTRLSEFARPPLRTLKASFEAAGIQVRFDELDNIAHNGTQVVEVVQDFFAQVLRTMRAGD